MWMKTAILLYILLCTVFQSWEKAQQGDLGNVKSVLQISHNVQHGFRIQTNVLDFIEELEKDHCDVIKQEHDEYRAFGRAESRTFKYWDTSPMGG